MKDPCIHTDKLNLKFGLTQALKNVSAAVGSGEIVGLIGRNGAGKSSLLEVLAGLVVPDTGTSQLLGHESRRLPDSVREQLGFVFQDDEMFGWMKVNDHIDVVGANYRHWDRQRALELAGRWDIPLSQRVASLSRGQRQKLGILLAIVHRPTVLLLDEPASALDPVSRREFLGELVALACDGKRTMVLSSHLLGDVERLADRIWLMRKGELIIDERLDELKDGMICLAFQGHAARTLPELQGIVNQREDEWGTVVVARHPGIEELTVLEDRFGSQLHIKALNLEQIALELL